MFRKKIINVSSHLKNDLHLGTKTESNRCLDIGTKGEWNYSLRQIKHWYILRFVIILVKIWVLLTLFFQHSYSF